MASIDFGKIGIASGIDTASIISALMAYERQPMVRLEQKSSLYSFRKTVLQDINTKLLSFYNASKTLLSALDDVWSTKTATSGDTDLLGVSATSSAVAATYKIKIDNLAQAHTVRSASQSSETAALNLNGNFTINGKQVSVVYTDSLQSIRNKINSTTDIGVTASIVDKALRITRKETGVTEITFSDQDAQKHEVASDAVVDPNADLGYLGGEKFTINGVEITVDVGDSLNALATKIDALAGVSAIVNGSNQLVITSDTFGWAGVITSSDTSGTVLQNLGVLNADNSTYKNVNAEAIDSILETLGVIDASNTPLIQLVAAKDAKIYIDNQEVIRSSNIISDAISGVTLTLKGKSTPDEITVTVGSDTDSIKSKITDWVNAYNTAYSLVSGKLSENIVKNPTTDADRQKGAFRNDYQLRGIKYELRRVLGLTVNNLPVDVQILDQIGISFETNGQMTIDDDELTDALTTDPSKVKDLFYKNYLQSYDENTAGLAVRVEKYLKNITNIYTGDIAKRDDAIDKIISNIETSIEKWEIKLAKVENNYKKQFSEMEKAIFAFQSQSKWLSNQLSSLQSLQRSFSTASTTSGLSGVR